MKTSTKEAEEVADHASRKPLNKKEKKLTNYARHLNTHVGRELEN